MKYDSIPTKVEAKQFLPGKIVPGVFKEVNADDYYVVDAQGVRTPIHFGEWVVTESDGIHHRVMLDTEFNRKYKVVPGEVEKEVKAETFTHESKIVHSGSVKAATNNTIKFDAEASTTVDAYKDHLVSVNTGGKSQVRNIISYNAITKTATIDKDWDTIPSLTSVFKIEEIKEVPIKIEEPKEEAKKEDVKKEEVKKT